MKKLIVVPEEFKNLILEQKGSIIIDPETDNLVHVNESGDTALYYHLPVVNPGNFSATTEPVNYKCN